MALPKAVQRQLEQADQLAAQLQAPMEAKPDVLTDASQLLAPATQVVEAPIAPAPVAPTPPAPSPTPPAENWEQRFKTVDGMYRREVPELRAANKTLESKVVALTEQVAALTKATTQQPEAPKKPTIDQRDVDAFGADMMEMVNRYLTGALQEFRAEVSSIAQNIDGRVTQLEQKVTGVSERTELTLEQQFYATLANLIPEWEQINARPRWLEWLAEVDPVYGVPRQQALDNALAHFDPQRAAAIFRQFIALNPAPVPASPETLRSPNGGGAAPAPQVAPAKKFITQKAVQDFYLAVSKGRYRGKEAEQAALEAEINLAAAEGRIV